MHIALDCTGLVPGSSAGIENFALRLAQGFAAAGTDTLEMLIPRGTRRPWIERLGASAERLTIHEVLGPASVRALARDGADRAAAAHLISWMRSSRLVSRVGIGWKNRQRKRALRTLGADVLYLPTHLGGCPRTREPSVVTIHDLRALATPFRDESAIRALEQCLRSAAAFVTSWEHPRSQLVERYPSIEPRLFTVPFPPMVSPEPGPAAVRPEPFLLYPAGTAPHKNHLRLLEAVASLRRDRPLRLVLTGPRIQPGYDRLMRRVAELGIADAVEHLGYLEERELKALYRGCAATVVPSLWEAASGPVLEALAYGRPVACARIGPIEAQVDTLGVPVAFFDPRSVGSMAAAIAEVLDHPARFVGKTDLDRTWTDVARDYRSIFEWVTNGARREALPLTAGPGDRRQG